MVKNVQASKDIITKFGRLLKILKNGTYTNYPKKALDWSNMRKKGTLWKSIGTVSNSI
jgi:hypothetical protein